jgi:hypothetical protein
MSIKKSIWTNPLFITITGALLTLIGLIIFFNYQRKIENEDNQTECINSLKAQVRANRIIDSLDYNELDKRLLKLENK